MLEILKINDELCRLIQEVANKYNLSVKTNLTILDGGEAYTTLTLTYQSEICVFNKKLTIRYIITHEFNEQYAIDITIYKNKEPIASGLVYLPVTNIANVKEVLMEIQERIDKYLQDLLKEIKIQEKRKTIEPEIISYLEHTFKIKPNKVEWINENQFIIKFKCKQVELDINCLIENNSIKVKQITLSDNSKEILQYYISPLLEIYKSMIAFL